MITSQPHYIQHLPRYMRVGMSLDTENSSLRVLSIAYFLFTWLSAILSILSTVDFQGKKLPIRAIYDFSHFLATVVVFPFIIKNRKHLCKLVNTVSKPFYDFQTGSSLRDKVLATYTKRVNRTGNFFVYYIALFISFFLVSLSPLLTLPFYSKDTPINDLPLPVGQIPFYTDFYIVYALAYAVSASAMCAEAVFNSCWLILFFISTHKIKAQLQLLVDSINYLGEKSMQRAIRDDERDETFRRSLLEGGDGHEIVTVHRTLEGDENKTDASVCISNNGITLNPGTYTLNRRLYISNYERRKAARQFKIQTKLPQEKMACLIEIIENHMEIIEFVNLLKMCYKPVLLISFQMAALIISFTFLQIVQIEKLEALVAVNVILTALCVLWAFNYAGQSIIDECDKLRFALYNLEWQGKPKEFVSSLRIMMIVSTRPLLLSVGDLYPLSMASYGKILSAAYSYINLLYSIQQGKNSE